MAWIAIDHTTPRKPELSRIVRATGHDRFFVLGLLVEFWIWAETMTVDGTIEIDLESLSPAVGGDLDFWRAVRDAGWLETPNGEQSAPVVIPRADHWLTNGAKSRMLNARRQAMSRIRNASELRQSDGCVTYRTEQNRTEPDLSPSGSPVPDSGASGSGQRPDAVPGRAGPKSAFEALTREHLSDIAALRSWLDWQWKLPRPVIAVSEQNALLLVVAAGIKSITKKNPVGYFATLVGKNNWDALTKSDRDAAAIRLRG